MTDKTRLTLARSWLNIYSQDDTTQEDVGNLYDLLTYVYNEGRNDGTKETYWTGYKAGIERYSYLWSKGPQEIWGDADKSIRCVGPNGTTTLKQALHDLEEIQNAAQNKSNISTDIS